MQNLQTNRLTNSLYPSSDVKIHDNDRDLTEILNDLFLKIIFDNEIILGNQRNPPIPDLSDHFIKKITIEDLDQSTYKYFVYIHRIDQSNVYYQVLNKDLLLSSLASFNQNVIENKTNEELHLGDMTKIEEDKFRRIALNFWDLVNFELIENTRKIRFLR